MKGEREKIVSVTKDDFRMDTFRVSGNGGQKVNKTNCGVRLTHIESGAVGEGRESRKQSENKKSAFFKCIESETFQNWLKKRISEHKGLLEKAKTYVEETTQGKFLKIEIKIDGRWVEIDSDFFD